MAVRVLINAVLLLGFAAPAYANVIWPGLILSQRLVAWWIIAGSLVIEFLFVWRAFKLTPLNAAFATIAANAVSAALGLILLPVAGMLVEGALHVTGIGLKIGWETFSPAAWLVTFILAAALSTAIELCFYRFAYRLPVDRRIVILFALANAITAGAALASLSIVPFDYY